MQNEPNLCLFWAVSGDCEEKRTQNEPNSQNDKMNVNLYITTDYENKHDWTLGENEPNSKPIYEMPKMNVNKVLTKDYGKNSPGWLCKNKPNQTQSKSKRIYPQGVPAEYATAKKPAPIKKA